jgi:hypothetical protein
MKKILVIFISACLPGAGHEQETRAHIPYRIPDGTPPPPQPPKPAWIVPATDVLAEEIHHEGGRRVTLREIQPIDLPPPPERTSQIEVSEDFRERMARYREKHPRHQIIALGATVYRLENQTTRTLVRVFGTGRSEPFSFWSSGDFSLLSGVGAFTDNEGETRALFMLWSVYDTNRFARRMAENGRPYTPPMVPELPADKAAYVINDGLPDDDALTAITSLHEILNRDAGKLKSAYEGREKPPKSARPFSRPIRPSQRTSFSIIGASKNLLKRKDHRNENTADHSLDLARDLAFRDRAIGHQ